MEGILSTAAAVRPGGVSHGGLDDRDCWRTHAATNAQWPITAARVHAGDDRGAPSSQMFAPASATRDGRGVAKPRLTGHRTRIMPQQRTTPDVKAPAGATAKTPVAGTTIPQQITPEQAAFLRARRGALSKQLESAQGRREEVVEALRSDETQAAERPGLEDRLKVLDQRLVQVEQEIAVNGEQLANAPAEAGSDAVVGVPARTGADGFLARANPNTVVFFSFLLLLPVVVRLSRRFIAPNRAPSRTELAEMAAIRERMDRLDGALDAVAIEVERIGEGQRFLTQAMTVNIPRVNAAGAMYEPVPVRQRDAADRR